MIINTWKYTQTFKNNVACPRVVTRLNQEEAMIFALPSKH